MIALGQAVTLKTAEYASLRAAWEGFGRHLDRPLPTALGMAVAGPVGADCFAHVCAPEGGLPGEGVTIILGSGTGLGVAQLIPVGLITHPQPGLYGAAAAFGKD